MIEVKRSTHEDLAFIVEELRKFSKFFATKVPLFPRDDQDAIRIVSRMIDDHLFFTSFNDGKRSGFISGWVAVHPFNPEIVMLTESLWWVKEQYRMTRAGSMLLDQFVAWGKENATWTTMTLENESPVSCGPLLKRGFRLKETSYILENT